jgi:lysophospholipase L1-like esterase
LLASASAANDSCDILLLGDSLINGRERLAEPLANYFQGNRALVGAGYCSFVDSNGPADGYMAKFYGNDGWIVNKGGSDAIGMDITDVTGLSAGLELRVSVKSEADEIDLYYKAQPGGGRFLVYSGDVLLTVVDTRTTHAETRVHSFDWPTEPTSVILKIVVEDAGAAGVCLAGLNFRANGDGFRIHEMGTGGLTSASFASVNRDNWVDSVAELDPELVCILLGANDHSFNRDPSAFKANIEELVSRIRQAKSDVEVLLLSPSDNGLEGRIYELADYRDALADIAITQNLGFVDLWAQLGDYADANAEGLYQDLLHPNRAGGNYICDAVVSVLDVIGVSQIDLIHLWDRAEVFEATNLTCNVVSGGVELSWRKFPGVDYSLIESESLETWDINDVIMPRARYSQTILLENLFAHFWKFELSYPLLWN